VIQVGFVKYLFALTGAVLMVVGIEDRNPSMVAGGLVLAVGLFYFGVLFERWIIRTRNEQRLTGGPWKLSPNTARNILIVVGAILLVFLIWGRL
jgi:hypothetical protein